MSEEFEFIPEQPRLWEGRYNRIPGEDSVFHIKSIDGEWWPVLVWKTGGETGTCPAEYSQEVQKFSVTLSKVKNALGGRYGGAFIINEFGQVIIPSTTHSRKRAYIGKIKGSIIFDNPFDDMEPIDLSDDSYLICGDLWEKPYVDNCYNLSGNGKIYLKRDEEHGIKKEYPPIQDKKLIQLLREIRGFKPIRFIVNPHGIVLTKRQDRLDEAWNPIYVGRIDKNLWFMEE